MTHRRIKTEYNLDPVIDKPNHFTNNFINNFFKKSDTN